MNDCSSETVKADNSRGRKTLKVVLDNTKKGDTEEIVNVADIGAYRDSNDLWGLQTN